MKIWFITGASRGFGAEITRAVLAAGDAVVATARDPQTLTDSFGAHPNLLPLRLDVTSEDEARDAIRATIERFGRLDVLVNNAGYGLLGAVEEASATDVERLFRTNVFGLLNVTRAALPQLRKQRSGHILNFSSLGGYQSVAGWGVYCATKFAVEGLTEALAHELAPLGIFATVIEPGFFRTDFLDQRSLVTTAARIDDYAGTVGQMRNFAGGHNHQQPNDPVKLAQALLTLVAATRPPVRLPLGPDAVRRIEEKHAFVNAELATWRGLAESMAFGV